MTSSVSDLRDGFNAFRLRQDKEALKAALKGEVGIVQGTRRRPNDGASDLEDDTSVESSPKGMIKVKGRIVIRKQLQMKLETRRSSAGFCFEHKNDPPCCLEWGSSSCDFSDWNTLLPRQTTYFKAIRQKTLLTKRLRGGTGGSKPPDERHATFDLGKRSTIAPQGLTLFDNNALDQIFDSTMPSVTNLHNENTRKRASSYHQAHGMGPLEDPKKPKMSLSIRHYTMSGKMKKSQVSLATAYVHPLEKKLRGSTSTISLSSSYTSISTTSTRKVPMTLKTSDQYFSSSPRKPERKSEIPTIEPENVTARRASAEVAAVSGLLISSVGQIATMTDAERDSEWLEWTSSSDDDFDEDQTDQNQSETDGLPMKKKRKGINKERTIQPELAAFLNSIKVLDKISTWLGLSPYSKVVRGNHCVQVKWVPKSLPFIAVLFNTVFFFTIAFGTTYNLLYIYGLREPLPISKKILKIDFANHFTETLFVAIISLFLFIYCVSSVMEQGVHFAEFMCRFNMGVFLTRYDVTEGVHNLVVRLIGIAGAVVAFCFILFFSRTTFADFRENCGFLGLAVLHPFDFDIRESTSFLFVEIFGLVIVLHCLISITVVLLQFMVYAKGIANMAKIFNLRLIYLFGETSKKLADGTWGQIKKQIPLEKLQAEQLIVVSLIRNLSHASVVYFGAFFLTIVLEIVLSMWLFFDLFLFSNDQPNLKGLSETKKGIVYLPVPLRVTMVKGESVAAALAMCGATWLTYFLFGGVVHHAGENMMVSIEYVRRHGLVHCSSSKERRFILSLINSFAPKNAYWLGKGFHFNRPFIVGFLGFVVGASMVTVAFRPDRTNLNIYNICNERGECTQIRAVRTVEEQLYKFFEPSPPPLPALPPGYITTTPATPLNTHLDYRFDYSSFVKNPPCLNGGGYPSVNSFNCEANWGGARTPSYLEIPFVYKPFSIVDSNTSAQYNYFGAIENTFYSEKTLSISKCRTTLYPSYNFPYTEEFGREPNGPPVDSFGNVINPNISDDCGTMPFSTANIEEGTRVDAKLKPVYVRNLPGLSSVDSVVCCFEYGGYPGSKIQVGVCNLPDADTFRSLCNTSSTRNRLQPANIKQNYRKLLARLHYQSEELGNPVEYVEKNEDAIRTCLCTLEDPQIAPMSEEDCACAGLQLLPCLPGYFTGIVEDYALTCGPVKVPLLFKASSDSSFVYPVEHERYRTYCNETSFSDRYSHKDELEYSYPCGFPDPPPSNLLRLTDCAGKPVEKLRKDDCSNWNVDLPDPKSNGEMNSPVLRLKVYNYNVSGKMFVANVAEEGKRSFVCCYEYRGQAFQTLNQTRFCNAPDLDSMNKDEWCGGVVKRERGIRDSTPFDAFIHDQLHRKLELTVRYHEAKNRPNWLEQNHEILSMCMCTNKLTEKNNQTIYKEWVGKCIPLFVKPLLAAEVDLFRPLPECPHKWPNYTEKGIITPFIFTFVNEIRESFERHQKISDPSVKNQCHIDESYEEVYKNDGNPLLYDLLLSQLPKRETDDCLNIPVRTFTEGKALQLHPPKIRLSPEYTMAKFDEKPFNQTKTVHCCYSYASFPKDQRLTCNLPNAATVINRCNNKTRSDQRLLHEFQLTRGLAVLKTGAYFIGDKVEKLEDFSLTPDTTWEGVWRQCICEDESASDSIHKMCIRRYLPPCIKSKGRVSSEIVKIDQMVTKCDSEWENSTATINIPIIMESKSDGNFDQVPLYLEGSTPKDCPTINTVVVQSSSGLTDCFGQTIPPLIALDDCKNPPIPTVNRTNLTQRVSATLELVPASQWKELEKITHPKISNDSVFCCYRYGISNVSDVRVCHLPSFESAVKNCEFRLRDGNLRKYLEKLVQRRQRGIDVLTDDIAFDNPARVAWTQCLCHADFTECERALNIGAYPCFWHPGPDKGKMFTECKGTWRSSVWYPTILQKFDETEYRQVMPLGEGNCDVVGKPLPIDTVWTIPHPPTLLYDCNKTEYSEIYQDDCGTPIFPMSDRLTAKIRINSRYIEDYRLSCVADFADFDLDQYSVFNVPNKHLYDSKCRHVSPRRYNYLFKHRSANAYLKYVLETKKTSVQCMCSDLPYVQDKFGNASDSTCQSFFDRFCPSPSTPC